MNYNTILKIHGKSIPKMHIRMTAIVLGEFYDQTQAHEETKKRTIDYCKVLFMAKINLDNYSVTNFKTCIQNLPVITYKIFITTTDLPIGFCINESNRGMFLLPSRFEYTIEFMCNSELIFFFSSFFCFFVRS